MTDVLLNLLQLNQTMDYSLILPAILLYMVFFWIIVSIWLFFDAKKRFQSKKVAFLISLGNFFFQLPFLLLYLLFRPIEEEYIDAPNQGGVNVPIVNFMGTDGVVMSLELRINNHKMMPQQASEMKIDVSFDSDDEAKKIIDATAVEVVDTKASKENVFKNIIQRIRAALPKKKVEGQVQETSESKEQQESEKDGSTEGLFKKKKKKKHKK
jgi:hypothetical protein